MKVRLFSVARLSYPLAAALAALLAAPAARATELYWDIDDATAGAGGAVPAGTWSTGGITWSTSSNGTVATPATTTAATDDLFFSAGVNATGAYGISLTTTQNAGSLTFQEGTATISGTSGIITLGGAGGKITVNNGASATIGATTDTIIGGSAGLTKGGVGTLSLSGSLANTFTGGITVNGGILALNFGNLGTPANLADGTNALALGGGQLTINAKTGAGINTDQTLGNVTVNSGGGRIFLNPAGGAATTLTLGTLTATTSGGSLTIGRAVGAGTGTATITTPTDKDATGTYGGRVVFANGTAGTGYDWATNTGGAGPFTLSAFSGYSPLATAAGTDSLNSSVSANTTLAAGAHVTNSLKFSAPATAQTLTIGAGNTLTLANGGLLITGAAVAQAPRIALGSITAGNGSGSYDLVVHNYNATNLAIPGGGAANVTNSTTISSVITNNGGDAVRLVKNGSGALNIAGVNTFTGGIVVNEGSLIAGVTGALNNNDIIFNSSAEFVTSGVETTSGSITLNNNSQVTLTNNNNSLTVNAPVTGTGGISIEKGGLGSITVNLNSTSNTFTGPIRFPHRQQNQNATLTVNSLADTAAFGEGNITFGFTPTTSVGLTISHNFNYGAGAIAPLTLNNRRFELATAQIAQQINNNSGQAVNINTDLLVSGATGKILTLGGTGLGVSTFAGKISNSGSPNVGTTLVGGIVAANATSIPLASVEGIAVGSTMTAAGYSGTITAINPATNVVTIAAATNPALGFGSTVTIAGVINSVSTVKAGAGTWILSGANTHSGGTVVNAGTLELSNGAAIADTAGVILANVASAVLKINNNETIGSLTGGGVTGGVVNLQANTLTVGGGSFNGAIQGSGGALTKTGAGTLTLAGGNSHTGATLVNGGALTVSGTGTLAGTSGLSVTGGAVFNYLPTTVGTTLTLGPASTLNLGDGSALGLAWNATTANNISALGAATVGSIAGVGLNMTGTYTPGTTYSILSAASGLDTGSYFFLNAIDYTAVVAKSATSVTITPTPATPISEAYWTGAATAGVTKVWAASDGSASNWAGIAGGAAQALVPGSGADVIISANSVAVPPTTTTLGANMTIKSLTIADTTNGLSLDADGYTLTITPGVATAGITMNANVPASSIAANVALGANQTWTNQSASPLTVSGVVSGAFGLTKAGTGTLVLSGVNTYSGGTTLNDNAGTLEVNGGGRLGSGAYAGAIAIGTGSTLQFSSSVAASGQTLSGAITGQGGLTFAPSVNNATLFLTNTGNLYFGTTAISGGRIAAGPANLSPNTTFAITGNSTSGGQLFLNATGTVANNLSIAGVGYVEADVLSTKAGAVRFANGSNLSGTVTLSGDARVGFIGAGSAILSGQITGSAGIEFFAGLAANNATNTLTLSNLGTAHDYTGNTTITAADFSAARTGGAAVLALGASDQIPNGSGKGNVVFSGADANHLTILDLSGFNETLNGVSNVAAAGAIIRNNAAGASVLTIGDVDTSSTFSGVISNTTGTLALTKIGSGTLALSGVNTFAGPTTISGGTLALDNSLALQNSPLDTLASIAGDPSNGLKTSVTALTFGGLTGDKNLAAMFTTTSGGYSGVTALTLLPGTGATPSYSGNIADGATGMTLTKSGTGAQTLNGVLSHTGGITVTGGTLTLGNAANSYPGTTLINAGGRGIIVTADGALGATGPGNETTVTGAGTLNGAALGIAGGVTYSAPEKVIGSGAGHTSGTVPGFTTANRGFIQGVGTGSSTFAGNIELGADGVSRIGTQDGAQLTLSGAITQGTGITTATILFRVGNLAGDFVTLSNAGNSFGGDSTVFTSLANPGEYAGVRLGISNGLPTDRTLSGFSGTGAGAALDLNGKNQSLNGLITGAAALNIINLDTVTSSILTLNPTVDKSATNTLILGGGALGVINLVKEGDFNQTLAGANSYTGTTTVTGGALTLGNASALGTSSATVTGGALNLGGQTIANAVDVGAAGTLTGSGTAGAATLAGSVTPGGTGSGLITVASATVAPTSSISLQLPATGTRGTNYDAITVSAALVLDGTVTVDITGLTAAAGQSFDLIDSTGPIDVTNFTVATDLILPALGGGLVWNTSAFAATGVVSIASGDPFPAWALSKGLTGLPGFEAGKGDDPDQDGKDNLHEFAFDGDPLSGVSDGKIVGKVATVSAAQVLTLTLPVRTGATFSDASGDELSALIDGLYYRIEGSVALSSFADDVTEVPAGTELTAIQAGLPALSTGWTYRSFRASGTVSTAPNSFLRAKATETP